MIHSYQTAGRDHNLSSVTSTQNIKTLILTNIFQSSQSITQPKSKHFSSCHIIFSKHWCNPATNKYGWTEES